MSDELEPERRKEKWGLFQSFSPFYPQTTELACWEYRERNLGTNSRMQQSVQVHTSVTKKKYYCSATTSSKQQQPINKGILRMLHIL